MQSLLALSLMPVAVSVFAADLQFSTEPPLINSGATAVLHWNASSASNVMLLGHGKVDPSGSLAVSPRETTLYTIVADGPAGLLAKTLRVEVQGARGVGFPSDEEQFRYPLSDWRKVQSESAFLDGVHRLLQNDLGFSVKAYSVGDVFVFLTNSSERPDLVGEDERRKMRARRISYWLDVQDQGGVLVYTLKTLIEFQLRAEETWHKEGREDLYRRKGTDLLTRLSALN